MVALAILFFSQGCQPENKTEQVDKAYFSGSITKYDKDTIYLENYSLKNLEFKDEIIKIPLSKDSTFSVEFAIEQSGYFKTGRNYLYISPGDSIVGYLDASDRSNSIYHGTGSEANNYLSSLPYPKAGSFWGDFVKNPFKAASYNDVLARFEKAKDRRLKELETLENVDTRFLALERDRIHLDFANSLLARFYLQYLVYRKQSLPKDQLEAELKKAKEVFKPYVRQALMDLNYGNELSQLEVFQSLLGALKNNEFIEEYGLNPLESSFKEYYATRELLLQLEQNGYSLKFSEQLNDFKSDYPTSRYSQVIEDRIEEYNNIRPGQPAQDLRFVDLDGNLVALESYRGKVIVIDLWATGCGPCMKEKPHFKELRTKFENNDSIVFLNVSIDNEQTWKSYFEKYKREGVQLQVDRNELSFYQINGIPRFMVIDKEFNIGDAFAPWPSSGNLERIISEKFI